MRRRDVIALFSLLPCAGWAQQTAKIPRVGFLSPTGPVSSLFLEGFRAGMKKHGYIEGRNIVVEYRWAYGQYDRLAGLAAELVHLDVDVILAIVTPASLAAHGATRTIPIVMAGVADPVEVGLVASLAKPGGNITGTSGMAADIVGKQLEMVKALAPGVSRVAVLWNPANAAFQALQVREAEAASRVLGLELQFIEASTLTEFDPAFVAIRGIGTRALLILTDPLFALHRAALVEFAKNERLLSVSGSREFSEAGGLVTYGPNYFDSTKRAFGYVDKILKGAKPADLPVERSTKFELIINLKTAKALGIAVPQSLLARADEVIE
jgi:putative ABC transport system substrate-binding protein